MTSPTATRPDRLPPNVPDDVLAVVAEDMLDAMLGAADVATIGVAHWWPRATTALTAAAARATSIRDMVTVMSGKLQVATLPEHTGRTVAGIEAALADPVTFARWRRIAERDAVYIAAMVRLRRADKRADKATKTSAAPAATDDTGAMF